MRSASVCRRRDRGFHQTRQPASPDDLCTGLRAGRLSGPLVLHSVIFRVDLPVIDQRLRYMTVAILITMIAVVGLTNAINIIDDFNGLASVVSMLIFASIAFVAYEVIDWFIMGVALTMIGAIAAFVFWNYPVPSVFLDDDGAYLVGFMMAELLVLLIARHPNVSAWYAMIVAIYPLVETLFSIYRRKIVRGRSAGDPDGLHLHRSCSAASCGNVSMAVMCANAMPHALACFGLFARGKRHQRRRPSARPA